MRYAGQFEAKATDEGWTLADSEANWTRQQAAAAAAGGGGGTAATEAFNAEGTMPQQVRS